MIAQTVRRVGSKPMLASRLIWNLSLTPSELLDEQPTETTMNSSKSRRGIRHRHEFLDPRIEKFTDLGNMQNRVSAATQEVGHLVDVLAKGATNVDVPSFGGIDTGLYDGPKQAVPRKHEAHLSRCHHQGTGLEAVWRRMFQEAKERFPLLVGPHPMAMKQKQIFARANTQRKVPSGRSPFFIRVVDA